MSFKAAGIGYSPTVSKSPCLSAGFPSLHQPEGNEQPLVKKPAGNCRQAMLVLDVGSELISEDCAVGSDSIPTSGCGIVPSHATELVQRKQASHPLLLIIIQLCHRNVMSLI